ncbi:hypothetical protein Q2Y22_001291 [Vibrio vulnificus]|nr:hypothetical protein [Vibrio vulnificus]
MKTLNAIFSVLLVAMPLLSPAAASDPNNKLLSQQKSTEIERYLTSRFDKAVLRAGTTFDNVTISPLTLVKAEYVDKHLNIGYFAKFDIKTDSNGGYRINIPTYQLVNGKKKVTNRIEATIDKGKNITIPIIGRLSQSKFWGDNKNSYINGKPFGGYYTQEVEPSDVLISQSMIKQLISKKYATFKPMKYEDAMYYVENFTDNHR